MNMRAIMETVGTMLREGVDTASPAFKRWFGRSKVVDSNGQPLMCYHGTAFGGEVESFKTLTHFGTLKAAQDRIDSKLEEPRGLFHPDKDKEISPHIYPVYLRVEKPISIPDCGMPPHGKFDPDCILRSLVQQRIVSRKRAKQITDTRQRIWTVLQGLGYDGARYRNSEEDRGSMSWIIFDGDQVWPVYSNAPDE